MASRQMKAIQFLVLLVLAGCTSQEAFFCHVDDCSSRIIHEISSARQEIVFAAYTFTEPSIGTAIILAHANGIDVKGVMEKRNMNSDYSQYSRLVGQGIDILPDANPALMHHKFFVIDNSTVITGSFNPTKAADESNDDNLIIVRNENMARQYAVEFQRIYDKAFGN
jgi:phosphatidylserine/phosphatidylglycerophosphate/cardiolipin synthase-like enzyme